MKNLKDLFYLILSKIDSKPTQTYYMILGVILFVIQLLFGVNFFNAILGSLVFVFIFFCIVKVTKKDSKIEKEVQENIENYITSQDKETQEAIAKYKNENQDKEVRKDDDYLGLKIVCFLFPVVGLIVYAVNIVQNPEIAKPCGKWALIGFICGIILVACIIAIQYL